MKLSFEWLSEYVDLTGASPQEVADKLTMGAFEVEDVRKTGPDLEGPLVVGEILEIYPHPNADKIRLTKIRVKAGEEPLEIICGAQNIQVGQKVPVALPGARVINRHDGTPLHIKVSSIRGVKSNGMLCSASELNLPTEDIDGILILAQASSTSLELGQDVRKLLQLYPDWILNVEPRSNRGDALCVKGLAKEVAALMKRPLTGPKWSLDAPKATNLAATTFSTAVENTVDCPLFTIRVIEGLAIGPSPLFIKRRLEAVGVRSVNNIVDITNYVMHELGQPLHAYDLAKLASNYLIVRRAAPNETIRTIDDRERKLSGEILVIADRLKPVGIAGIMGGKESEINNKTSKIALEAACFEPARVRKSSRLAGLTSDSSLRFERGVDQAQVASASDRASYLIAKYCGGESGAHAQVGHFSQTGVSEIAKKKISLRLNQLPRLVDIELSASEVKDLLSPLGLVVETGENKQEVIVNVPSFRQKDITREIDLIEEICRLWGYDRVPSSMPRSTVLAPVPDDLWQRIRHNFSGQGLDEALLSSLVSADNDGGADKTRSSFGMANKASLIRVLNPLSEDHQALRQSLLPGLIRTLKYNQDRGLKDAWLFELGFVYEKRSRSVDNSHIDSKDIISESPRAAFAIMGERELSSWVKPSYKEIDDRGILQFYVAKGIVENLLTDLGVKPSGIQFVRKVSAPFSLHPLRSCQITVLDRIKETGSVEKDSVFTLGWLGQLNPAIQDLLEFRYPACLLEIDLNQLQAAVYEKGFTDLPVTPTVSRDLTVDVKKSIDHAQVESLIRTLSGPHLRACELASVFGLSEEKKSLCYQLTFQHPSETLTKEEVEEAIEAIRQGLTSQMSASFRY